MSMISELVKELRWIADYEYQSRNSEDTIRRAADTIEMLSKKVREPKQAWISCEERLPEEMGIYLCTVGAPYRNPREMYYAPQAWADKSDNATWRSIDGSYVFDWFVEAWQPLPEPYMKGADE